MPGLCVLCGIRARALLAVAWSLAGTRSYLSCFLIEVRTTAGLAAALPCPFPVSLGQVSQAARSRERAVGLRLPPAPAGGRQWGLGAPDQLLWVPLQDRR